MSSDLQLNESYLGALETYQDLYQTEKKAADSLETERNSAVASAEEAQEEIKKWRDEADDIGKALSEAYWNMKYYKDLYTLQEKENWYLKKQIEKKQQRIDEQAIEINNLKKRIEQLIKTLEQLTQQGGI